MDDFFDSPTTLESLNITPVQTNDEFLVPVLKNWSNEVKEKVDPDNHGEAESRNPDRPKAEDLEPPNSPEEEIYSPDSDHDCSSGSPNVLDITPAQIHEDKMSSPILKKEPDEMDGSDDQVKRESRHPESHKTGEEISSPDSDRDCSSGSSSLTEASESEASVQEALENKSNERELEIDGWGKWYLEKYKEEKEKKEKEKEEARSKEKNRLAAAEKEIENRRRAQAYFSSWLKKKKEEEKLEIKAQSERREAEATARQEGKARNQKAFCEWLRTHPPSSTSARLACGTFQFRKVYYKDGTKPPPPSVVNFVPWKGTS